MLVLTRRPNEVIVLPGLNVTIRVAAIKGNAVRIGIEAPPDVGVFREEVLARRAQFRTAGDVAPTCVVVAG